MTYTRTNPYFASISERFCLNKPGSKKDTQHVVLNIRDSGIRYEVGDSVGVLPTNDPETVKKTLQAMQASADTTVVNQKTGEKLSLELFLSRYSNISDISKSLIKDVVERQTNPEKKEKLSSLLDKANKIALKEYMESHELWDFLMENQEGLPSPQEICDRLRGLIPRLYSIASSMKSVGDEIHLTIAKVIYQTNGFTRRGIATNYLCDLAPLNDLSVPIYIQKTNDFRLPENPETPLIMVGPGTGIAPFRAFMQERVTTKAPGNNWLFFGEWNKNYDFFYEDYWTRLQQEKLLKLSIAFSRDQDHKIYVQHKMEENATEFWRWIKDGAHFYVCGDSTYMAKDVDQTLHKIVEQEGNMSPEEAKTYIKQMKSDKRYLRDVY